MSNSSRPKNSSDILIDENTLNDIMIDMSGTGISTDCMTITIPSQPYIGDITITGGSSGASTYTIQSGGGYTISSPDTITITGTDNYNWSAFNIPVEWVDCLPPLSRIQDMCEKYPGLKIAFDNFKVFYEMCKDDYDNPTPKK